jgi:hypothetical protein
LDSREMSRRPNPYRHAHTTDTTSEPNSRASVPCDWFGEASR